MRIESLRHCKSAACAVLVAIGLWQSHAPAPDPVRVLFSFDEEEGSYPDTDLVVDDAGNLYGMTVEGGRYGAGTVFRLAHTGEGWVHSVLYEFTGGTDGGQPYGGVTLDAQGNVYGTTVIGGTSTTCEDGCGTAFKLTKSATTPWAETVLHDFPGGVDGSGPGGPVTFDGAGNLYGVTPTGGKYGIGTVFQLSPRPSGPWQETIIHDFTGGEDGGAGSAGRLLVDAGGIILGVATVGGANGLGVAYRMTPLGGGAWDFETLYSFEGSPKGVFPYGGLLRDDDGNLYGTTYYGGTKNVGVAFQLSQSGGVWSETVLHDFQGGEDGANSIAGLVLGKNGRLYGTTSEGGASCSCGTLFELRHTDTGWKERIVHTFTGPPDGSYPYAGLVVDRNGTLYGATVHGGEDDDGSVYAYRP